MKLKIAKRIVNKNKWKAADIKLKGDGSSRTKSDNYLLKQIEKAKKVISKAD